MTRVPVNVPLLLVAYWAAIGFVVWRLWRWLRP